MEPAASTRLPSPGGTSTTPRQAVPLLPSLSPSQRDQGRSSWDTSRLAGLATLCAPSTRSLLLPLGVSPAITVPPPRGICKDPRVLLVEDIPAESRAPDPPTARQADPEARGPAPAAAPGRPPSGPRWEPRPAICGPPSHPIRPAEPPPLPRDRRRGELRMAVPELIPWETAPAIPGHASHSRHAPVKLPLPRAYLRRRAFQHSV